MAANQITRNGRTFNLKRVQRLDKQGHLYLWAEAGQSGHQTAASRDEALLDIGAHTAFTATADFGAP